MTPLLTTKEAARILNTSRWGIADLVRAGRLEAVMLGARRRRFRPEAIASFIADSRINAADVPVAIGELEDRIGCDICGLHGACHRPWCPESRGESHA